ncbi:MAG: FHA domain-containing protein [Bdellovibrionota bacterium]
MKLIIRKDGQFFKEVDFSGSELIIGRSNEAGVQLLHEDISRKHVKISRTSNKIIIEDLGSKNGTMLQGAPIQKSEIQEGEVFTMGPFSISIESVAPQAQRTVVEHSIEDEPSTRSFNEDTNLSRPKIKSDDFPSASSPEEEEEPNSDSFLDAIAVSKKQDEDIESEAFIEAEPESEQVDPDSEPVIEYSKPTDPYKKVPEYLEEAKARKKKGKKKPKPEDEDYKTTPYQTFSPNWMRKKSLSQWIDPMKLKSKPGEAS